jgi:hypothetical protein
MKAETGVVSGSDGLDCRFMSENRDRPRDEGSVALPGKRLLNNVNLDFINKDCKSSKKWITSILF